MLDEKYRTKATRLLFNGKEYSIVRARKMGDKLMVYDINGKKFCITKNDKFNKGFLRDIIIKCSNNIY